MHRPILTRNPPAVTRARERAKLMEHERRTPEGRPNVRSAQGRPIVEAAGATEHGRADRGACRTTSAIAISPGRAASRTTSRSCASGRRSRATRSSACTTWSSRTAPKSTSTTRRSSIRYNFFRDEIDGGADAIFGLDIPLMRLVHVLKAAAEGYGPEKRVILLHGPVGSSQDARSRACSRRASSTTRARPKARSTRSTGSTSRAPASPAAATRRVRLARCTRSRCASSRRSGATRRSSELGLSNDKFKVRVDGDLDPGEPLHLQAA